MQQEGERDFRWFLSLCDVGQEVLYLTLCSLYRGGHRRPHAYMRDVVGWTYEQFIACFTLEQQTRLTLDNNTTYDIHTVAENYGVDLSLALLKWTCDLAKPSVLEWNHLPLDTLEHRLHDVASTVHQFYAGHLTVIKSEEGLKAAVEGLKELYVGILYEASRRGDFDLTHAIAGIVSRLNSVLGHHTQVEDPLRYSKVLVREGQPELLRSCLASEGYIRPLPVASLLLSSVYMEYTIYEQNTKGTFKLPPRIFPASQILHKVNGKEGEAEGRVLLGGATGTGKTTLFRHLMNAWVGIFPRVESMDLEKIQLFFMINLPTTRSTTADQLVREELLPSTCWHFPADRLLPALRGVRVLWVLDGYDRASDKAKKLAHEIYKKFPFVIITCQEDFLSVCVPLVVDSGVPPLCLIFSHSYVKAPILASRVLDALPLSTRPFPDNPAMAPPPHVSVKPLHTTLLALLCWYNPSRIQTVKTITDLYRHLLHEIISDMTENIANTKKMSRQDVFLKVVWPLLAILGKDAWLGLQAGCQWLQDTSLRQAKALCGDSLDQLLGTFLECRQGSDGQREYYWGLAELQDHLAATHLLTLRKNRAGSMRGLLGQCQARYCNMLLHLLGHLYTHQGGGTLKKFSSSATEIVEYMNEAGYGKEKPHSMAGRVNPWIRVCEETGLDTQVMKTAAIMPPTLSFENADLMLHFTAVKKMLTKVDKLPVIINYAGELSEIQKVQELMDAISLQKHMVWLHMESSSMAYGSKQLNDCLLENAIKKKHLYILSVEGHYSPAFLRDLPSYMLDLRVRVTAREQLEALEEAVQRLKLLSFQLVVDLPQLRDKKLTLPTLPITWFTRGDTLPKAKLWLFVPMMEDSHLPWLHMALCCIYPTLYERLYLPKCWLTPQGERRLVAKLRKTAQYTVEELMYDKPDGTCIHYNFQAERQGKRQDSS